MRLALMASVAAAGLLMNAPASKAAGDLNLICSAMW